MDRYLPRNRHEAREQLWEELQSSRSGLPDFSDCRLPPKITKIVDEITNSLKVDRGLVLLSLLATAAGLDRGVHQVVNTMTGDINTLSTFVLAAATSGEGKSRALKPFLDIIEYLQPKPSEDSSTHIEGMKKRKNKLTNDFAKTGNTDYLNKAKEVGREIKALEDIPILRISEITKQAFVRLMAKQGFIMRLEPDGIMCDTSLHTLLTKAWSGEGHSEELITRQGNKFTNSLIVDLVLTQPIKFFDFIQDESVTKTGLLARTLCYHVSTNNNRANLTPHRAIDKDCIKFTEYLLRNIFTNASESTNSIEIPFERESALELDNYKKYIEEGLKCGRYNEIKEWARRAPQHAARVAGIIFLLEDDTHPMARKSISIDYVDIAINIIEIIMNNLYECVHGFYDDNLKKITCEIGLKILEDNKSIFNETDFKQSVKNKYSAGDIDIAFRNLENRGLITRRDSRDRRERRRGRPQGSDIINNFYESPFPLLGPLSLSSR